MTDKFDLIAYKEALKKQLKHRRMLLVNYPNNNVEAQADRIVLINGLEEQLRNGTNW